MIDSLDYLSAYTRIKQMLILAALFRIVVKQTIKYLMNKFISKTCNIRDVLEGIFVSIAFSIVLLIYGTAGQQLLE